MLKHYIDMLNNPTVVSLENNAVYKRQVSNPKPEAKTILTSMISSPIDRIELAEQKSFIPEYRIPVVTSQNVLPAAALQSTAEASEEPSLEFNSENRDLPIDYSDVEPSLLEVVLEADNEQEQLTQALVAEDIVDREYVYKVIVGGPLGEFFGMFALEKVNEKLRNMLQAKSVLGA